MESFGNGQPAVGYGFLPMVGNAPGGDFFGGGAGGGGPGGPFEISGGKVVNCTLGYGRAYASCGDAELSVLGEDSTPSGVIYARLSHGGDGSPTLSVGHAASLPESTLSATYKLLYEARDGYWVDHRFVQAVQLMD